MKTNTNTLEEEKSTDLNFTELVKIKPEKDFEIIADDYGYEKRKFAYFLSIPLMWMFTLWVMVKKFCYSPKTNTLWFDGVSPVCRSIKDGASSWKALDIICNYKFDEQTGTCGFISDFWLGMMNAQAVRNRKKIAKRELLKAIRKFASQEQLVNILSIASGSAQALLETIEEATAEGIKIKAVCIDIDEKAVEYSNNLIKAHKLEEICIAKTGTVFSMIKFPAFQPHIIEMIGFLDYRPHLKAVKLLEKLYSYLSKGGVLLTANIMPNPEMHFLKWVIDWPMIYRSPNQLGEMVVEAGFDIDNCKIFCEPHNIHAIIYAQK
ncbi:MAG: class I SAM-dependent methyltransferase family protein [bacterium]